MRRFILQIFMLILITSPLFPQNSEQDILLLFQKYRSDEAIPKIQSLIEQNRGSAFALFGEALIEPNANRAVEKYKLILSKYPNSPHAEIALVKIAHYYFSRGLYIGARKYFLQLIENYPQSPFIDDSMYFAAACLCASGKYESCYAELQNFLNQNKGSAFIKLAKEDLTDLDKRGEFVRPNMIVKNENGRFALQIGAFSQVNNALNLKKYCIRLGLPVEIREKTENNATLYLVWIGAFQTREAARLYGVNFKKEHGKPYRIVQR